MSALAVKENQELYARLAVSDQKPQSGRVGLSPCCSHGLLVVDAGPLVYVPLDHYTANNRCLRAAS